MNQFYSIKSKSCLLKAKSCTHLFKYQAACSNLL